MKSVLLLIAFISMGFRGYAQDKIIKKSGERIMARVTEITLHDVICKLNQHPDMSADTIAKAEIAQIRFGNGLVETLEENPEPMDEPCPQGRKDAMMYYGEVNRAATLTGLATVFLTPVGGLIPAVVPLLSNPKTRT